MIDHLGGSDRRHPDPALWRALPAKILPVCGTGGRCGNGRHEDSSRLRCLRCLPFAGVAANMCSLQKAGRRTRGDTGMQNQERKSVHRLRRPVCSLLQVCLPACVLRKKNWQENQGGYGNVESGAEVCPSPALSKVFAFTSVPATCGFPHKKIPRRESRGIFIRHLR